MSTLSGIASKGEKGKSKFQSLDINSLYRVSESFPSYCYISVSCLSVVQVVLNSECHETTSVILCVGSGRILGATSTEKYVTSQTWHAESGQSAISTTTASQFTEPEV